MEEAAREVIIGEGCCYEDHIYMSSTYEEKVATIETNKGFQAKSNPELLASVKWKED